MTRYDAAGDVKRSRYPFWMPLIILVLGGVMLIAGLVSIRKTDMKKYLGNFSADEVVEGADISELDIELGAAEITIAKSSDDDIHIEAEGIPYKIHQRTERKRLFIYSDDEDLGITSIWVPIVSKKSFNGKITILIPDKEYSLIDIDCGICKLKADDITCDKLKLDVGAADVDLSGITCTGEAEFDIGMAGVDMKNSSLFKSDFDIGMGEFDYEGTIEGETMIDCGMGDADFVINGSRSDYHITKSGKVSIKGSGSDNSDGIRIDADSSAANIKLEFKN
ncbi:MAG: hypothetical protein IJ571_05705 [Ruminococcus sp.]|nr:hypothetical protein [Ruminococcus sp.]